MRQFAIRTFNNRLYDFLAECNGDILSTRANWLHISTEPCDVIDIHWACLMNVGKTPIKEDSSLMEKVP